ncbi:MAG: SDR family oxidoreductase [Kiloniellaceae bacterium]|nr:SDR family oxidoreductase [Kiloniellaceae bacterium]
MAESSILVTGASRGIGRAVCDRLAEDGHDVIGVARHAPEDFLGSFYSADLTDEAAAKTVFAEIAAAHAVLRLVHCAGLVDPARIEDVTDAQFADAMRLNVQAAIWAMQAFLPAMRAARFGRIVVIGSRAGLGKATRLTYSTSKAALLGLTRTAALELAAEGITVNNVAPGPIETELFSAATPPGSPQREAFVATVPMGRVGRPEEVAAAVVYFLSDAAGFTTGQTLYVCGGLSVANPA